MESREHELLKAYADLGEESAFEELVSLHLEFVYRVAFRLVKDHQQSEDICQSVFTALAQRARQKGAIVHLRT